MTKSPKLAAFDFDHTLIDVNSDIYIDKLLLNKQNDTENGVKNKRYKYPAEIESEPSWTRRMAGVLSFMHDTHGITQDELLSCLGEIQIDPNMVELVKHLKDNHYDLVIISDANTVFIDEILKRNGLEGYFSAVYTNKARFDESGRLTVRPFNEEFNQTHECLSPGVCSSNMCKSAILRHHLDVMKGNNGDDERSLFYAGDGHNDYCPGLVLKPSDLYFIRKGFSLFKTLQSNEEFRSRLNVNVNYWDKASDILNTLKSS